MINLKKLIKNELMLDGVCGHDEFIIEIINDNVINKIENYSEQLDSIDNKELAEACSKINLKLGDENYDFNNDTVKILIHDAIYDLNDYIKEIVRYTLKKYNNKYNLNIN